MFKLRAYGKIDQLFDTIAGRIALIQLPHDVAGWAHPVEIECVARSAAMVEAIAAFSAGQAVWVDGRAYIERDDAGPNLHIDLDAIAEQSPGLTAGVGFMTATASGTIGTADDYVGQRRDGDPFWRFRLSVQVPEMPPGALIDLRVKLSGPDAEWVQHRHAAGDRITVEGTLHEARWRDGGGVPRRAFEVKVRDRWWFAKPSDPQRRRTRRVISERITSRPHQKAPEIDDA